MGTLKAIIGIVITAMLVLISCISKAGEGTKNSPAVRDQYSIIDTSGNSIFNRFDPPPGFERTMIDTASFGFYLRHLKLKTFGTPVRYYNGQPKNAKDVYISVIDMDIGKRDLQQCADAIMRLRSEFLYAQQKYQDIHFNFLSDGQPRYYKEYIEGDYSYEKFRKYLDYVFSYANTRSLNQELIGLDSMEDMELGDVFIQTGTPYGHAVIVVDMAKNPDSGKKVFMLAQSYMPAQDIQVLINRNDSMISPWYILDNTIVVTPEWTFDPEDLKRFDD